MRSDLPQKFLICSHGHPGRPDLFFVFPNRPNAALRRVIDSVERDAVTASQAEGPSSNLIFLSKSPTMSRREAVPRFRISHPSHRAGPARLRSATLRRRRDPRPRQGSHHAQVRSASWGSPDEITRRSRNIARLDVSAGVMRTREPYGTALEAGMEQPSLCDIRSSKFHNPTEGKSGNTIRWYNASSGGSSSSCCWRDVDARSSISFWMSNASMMSRVCSKPQGLAHSSASPLRTATYSTLIPLHNRMLIRRGRI